LLSHPRVSGPSTGRNYVLQRNFACHNGDFLEHSCHVFDDIGIPKTENNNAPSGKPSIAASVAADLRRKIMLTAIEFDRQTQLGAVKIEHEWSCWMLPPESMAIDLSIAQSVPEAAFDDSRILAQSARRSRLHRRSIESRHGIDPHRARKSAPTSPFQGPFQGEVEQAARLRPNMIPGAGSAHKSY
jgi:hypothetical protein